MKFCTKCGYQAADDDAFCYQCGNKLENKVKGKNNKKIYVVVIIGFVILLSALLLIIDKSNKEKAGELSNKITEINERQNKTGEEDNNVLNETSEEISNDLAIDILKNVFQTQNINKLKMLIIGNTKTEQIDVINDYLVRTAYNLNVISVEDMTIELLQRFKNKYPNDVDWERYKIEDMKVYDVQAFPSNKKVWDTFEAYVVVVKTDKGEKILTYSNKLLAEDFKTKKENISFDMYARNTNKYAGKRIGFEGEIVQTMYDGNYCEMRINVTKNDYGYYSDTIYAFYYLEEGQDKFLDGDIVDAYGTIIGENSYTSVLGAEIQLPLIEIKSMELLK